MVNITEKEGIKLSEADISGFEEKNGIKLPEDYASWLLEHNGGVPDRKKVRFHATEDKMHKCKRFELFVSKFISVISPENEFGENYEILKERAKRKKYLKDMIPIGLGWGELARNLFVMNISHENPGKVFYYSYDFDDCFIIADSFTQFCEMLTLD